MSILTGIAIYFVVWWISLFLVLPWGNKPSNHVTKGNIESAPAKPRIFLKCCITTLVSSIFWLVIFYVVEINLIKI